MDQRVKEALAEVQMEGYEDRYPREMSGGQQQRIALARMLAYRPKVFLMDEPLSNLDARLRMDMRSELKRLHHDAGATTHVCHPRPGGSPDHVIQHRRDESRASSSSWIPRIASTTSRPIYSWPISSAIPR